MEEYEENLGDDVTVPKPNYGDGSIIVNLLKCIEL